MEHVPRGTGDLTGPKRYIDTVYLLAREVRAASAEKRRCDRELAGVLHEMHASSLPALARAAAHQPTC